MSIIFGHTIQKYKEILKGAKYFPGKIVKNQKTSVEWERSSRKEILPDYNGVQQVRTISERTERYDEEDDYSLRLKAQIHINKVKMGTLITDATQPRIYN